MRDANGNDALDLIAWINDFDDRSEQSEFTETSESWQLIYACKQYLSELVGDK